MPTLVDLLSPYMQVVAAELNNASSREIVMFIIRVADDSGEWSVARRFRNFETLHRAMRGCGGGRDTCIPEQQPPLVLVSAYYHPTLRTCAPVIQC